MFSPQKNFKSVWCRMQRPGAESLPASMSERGSVSKALGLGAERGPGERPHLSVWGSECIRNRRRPRAPPPGTAGPTAVRPSPPHSLPARPPITVFTTIRSTRRGVVFPSLKLLSNGDFEERAQRKHTLFPLLSLRGPHRSPGQAAGQVPG